eukprot:343172_1
MVNHKYFILVLIHWMIQFQRVLSYLERSEINAIYDIYHNLNGPNWNCRLNLSQINNTNLHIPDQCGFYFDSFNDSNDTESVPQFVIKIKLYDDHNINGTIPSSIAQFTHIQEIFLADISLSGSIPSAICTLTDLDQFILEYLDLEGDIPACMMTELDLSAFCLDNTPALFMNQTTAELMCNWNNLGLFILVAMNFTASIPHCLATNSLYWLELGELPNLYGSIPHNIIYNTTQLRNFELFYLNNLSGTINDIIFANNPSLYSVDLEYISISVPIPDIICNLTYLSEFFWSGSSDYFQSTIPSCFGNNFTSLKFFSISGSAFYSTLPESICNMNRRLLGFFLVDTFINGTLPKCLSNFTDLVFLDVENNINLRGEIPHFNSNKTQLLVITNNSLEYSFSDKFTLSGYPNLQYVALHENNFNDDISHLLQKLFIYSPNLKVFSSYNNNNIRGTIPDFKKDVYLDVMQIFATHNCDIYGSLPQKVHFGRNLSDHDTTVVSAITLYNNRLSSDIPPHLMLQSNLTPVVIYGNLLSITNNKNELKWMNNSRFINTNLYVDSTTNIKNWSVLIVCIIIVTILIVQKLYQCYIRSCFKSKTTYFSSRSLIFLANIRTIQQELLNSRMIIIATSLLILYPFCNNYYLSSPVLSYFALYYFQSDNLFILCVLLVLLIGYNYSICYITQKLIVIYAQITKETEETLLDHDNNTHNSNNNDIEEQISIIHPAIQLVLYSIFYIICLTVSISYILLENDNIFGFSYSTRFFITYSISFLLAILNAIVTPRMVTSICLVFNISMSKHRSKIIVISRTFTTIIMPLIASVIFLNDCGSVWTDMWPLCLQTNPSPFDIQLVIEPTPYIASDGILSFSNITLNILDREQICLSRSLFEINWNRCFHSFLSSWTEVLLNKMIIMIFMPIFIVLFKLIRAKLISVLCSNRIKEKYKYLIKNELEIDSEYTMIINKIETG